MPVGLAHAVLAVVAAYLAIGTAVGGAFVAFGAAGVDPGARGAPWTLRLLILPGVIALWPWAALRWARSGRRL